MCGIAGILNQQSGQPVEERELRQMLGMIRHRGPDQFGIYLDCSVGLGSARLSIIDLSTGQQPIPNQDGSMWIVFNGEIFNYLELRSELEAKGHQFRTSSDTEVLLHSYEEFGSSCLSRLNGQFAFAIWNRNDRSLFLGRDRLGVRPLFYTVQHGSLLFGSEIKALLSDPRVKAEIDPCVLDQTFTYWSPLSPRSIFCGIFEVPPGAFLVARDGKISVSHYWQPSFPCVEDPRGAPTPARDTLSYQEEFRALLIDATKLRLRADVPVGAYLSGGLDSSIIASIVRNFAGNPLDTFSIAFDDAQFDESAWQRKMATFLGTGHQVVRASYEDIGRIFPEVVWHAEVPLLRTSPAPMFLLSKLVRESGYKVVLTGEGADEFLAGYDIFKEAKIRRFWSKEPESRCRSQLLQRLYPDISGLGRSHPAFLSAFFRENLTEVDSPDYSHATRWRNGRRNGRFLSEDVKRYTQEPNDALGSQLSADFPRWEPLARAQYLEIKIFLSQYLLSSQGDRMGMANSIEGRFPFLDHRVVEFCNQLPPKLKLRGLTDKYLLRKVGQEWLPPEIWKRPKRPYRAPIHRSFFHPKAPDYVRELLSLGSLQKTGYFKPQAVDHLVQKVQKGLPVSENDDMALAGILSTQLLHQRFIEDFPSIRPLSASDPVKVCTGKEIA